MAGAAVMMIWSDEPATGVGLPDAILIIVCPG